MDEYWKPPATVLRRQGKPTKLKLENLRLGHGAPFLPYPCWMPPIESDYVSAFSALAAN